MNLSVTPADVCGLCQMELGEPTETDPNMLILLESGQILPMKRDPHRFMLYADWRARNAPVDTIKEIYHASCFFEVMGPRWSKVTETYECAACDEDTPHDFRRNRYGFKIRLGELDMIDFEFVPKQDDQNEAHVCCACISKVFEPRRETDLRSVG